MTAQKPLPIGSSVFVPKTGVARVVARERKSFGAETQEFYRLELSRGASMYMPVDGVERAGLRDLVSESEARTLLQRITESVPLIRSSEARKERTARYEAAVASGCAQHYTRALQELLYRSRTAALSSRDQALLATLRGYFVDEMAVALNEPPASVEKILDVQAAAG